MQIKPHKNLGNHNVCTTVGMSVLLLFWAVKVLNTNPIVWHAHSQRVCNKFLHFTI